MPIEIEKELMKCEQSLYVMQSNYPQLTRTAAECRFVYDQAWANAIDNIGHQAIAAGEKMPTVAMMEAMATIRVAKEMEAARIAEADLDGAKKHIDSLQAILSSVQTRAKLASLEMSLAR